MKLTLAALALATLAAGGGAAAQTTTQTTPQGAARALVDLLQATAPELEENHELRLAKLEAILRVEPDHAVARMLAAWAAWRLERFDVAADHYARLQGPRAETGALWRANALAAAGEDSDARDAYDDCARKHAVTFWAPCPLPGEDITGNEARASLYWRRAARSAPGSALRHWLLGNALVGESRYAEALEAYEKAMALDPGMQALSVSASMAAHRAGDTAGARRRIDGVLAEDPGHRAARSVACLIEWEAGDLVRALPHYRALVADLGRSTPELELVRAAVVARHAGDVAFGVECLGRYARYGTMPRAILGGDDNTVLRSFIGRQPATVLDRYALASALYGEISDVARNPDFLTFEARMQAIVAVNQLSPQDLELQRTLERDAEAAIARFDIEASMRGNFLAKLQPHMGRVIRELRAALAERPDFVGAKVLLAEILHEDGDVQGGVALLRGVLASHPDATAVRRRLADRVSLEEALDLLEGASPEEAGETRIAACLAMLEGRAGDSRRAAERALAVTRRDAAYWDMAEIVAFDAVKRGQKDLALGLLDASCRNGRSARGMLTRATLRIELRRPGTAEALIDAWRAAPSDSSEEARSRELLRGVESAAFICGRCGGSGAISVTSGSTGQFGSIQTVQEWCPQCKGLGLWHSGAF